MAISSILSQLSSSAHDFAGIRVCFYKALNRQSPPCLSSPAPDGPSDRTHTGLIHVFAVMGKGPHTLCVNSGCQSLRMALVAAWSDERRREGEGKSRLTSGGQRGSASVCVPFSGTSVTTVQTQAANPLLPLCRLHS